MHTLTLTDAEGELLSLLTCDAATLPAAMRGAHQFSCCVVQLEQRDVFIALDGVDVAPVFVPCECLACQFDRLN